MLLAHALRLIHIVLPCLKITAHSANGLWFCHSLERLPPVTRPGPLREVLAVIQAGLSGSVGGHVLSFAALGCQVVEVLSPAPGRAALLSHAVCPAASVGTSRRLRLLRVPTSGAGDGFPRRALLNTVRSYCSFSIGEGDVKGGPVLISGLRRGTYSALGRFIGSRI